MDISSPEYKRAFEAYLRRGTPISLSLKNERTTTRYIWRTQGGDKVRPSHAANDGKVFAWDDPPPTGHPGEDFGCRCTAEPYLPEIGERVDITFSGISDAGRRWTSQDFVNHYYDGNGRGVTVRETGHLQAIVDRYERIVVDDIEVLPSQIAQRARDRGDGVFSGTFERPYRMTSVVFSIGNTVIGGSYTGTCSEQDGIVTFSGDLDVYLRDEFADPLGLGIEVIDIPETIDENLLKPAEDRLRQRIERLLRNRLQQRKQDGFGIHMGEPYPITDEWAGSFRGRVYADLGRSVYMPTPP